MNAPKRLKIRQPITAPIDFSITDIIPVFHRWIQENSVPGLLIDVANYKHVPNGPGILLISDEGDYSLEQIDGQFFFVYDRKRQTGGDLNESIRILLTTIHTAVQALKAESSLNLSAATGATEITILDRLHYPNEQAIFDAIRDSIREEVSKSYNQTNVSANVHLTYAPTDARRPLTLQIEADYQAVAA